MFHSKELIQELLNEAVNKQCLRALFQFCGHRELQDTAEGFEANLIVFHNVIANDNRDCVETVLDEDSSRIGIRFYRNGETFKEDQFIIQEPNNEQQWNDNQQIIRTVCYNYLAEQDKE